jgi:glycosyltransferase involved in cell wall biosynthesis
MEHPIKKHIVFLTDCLVSNEAGGAERSIFELTKRINKQQFDVTIASLDWGGTAPQKHIESLGCRLAVFPVQRIYGLSGIREGFRFYRFLKSQKVQVLQTYHFGSDIWGSLIAHLAGVPLIISSRRDRGFWRKKHHIFCYRRVNRWVSKICVVSNAVKDMVVEEEGVNPDKVRVIYNGVDVNNFQSVHQNFDLRKQLGLSAEDVVLIYVGNLRPVKGHIYLIKALKKIVHTHPSTKLLLVGEGEEEQTLRHLAKELDIEKNVLFLGQRSDVKDLLNIADIGVLTSLSEGMSNALLEYMAMAKPVVATNVGGNKDNVTDGLTGILVPPQDDESLADALIKLAKDSALRQSMGQAGRKRIEDLFHIERTVQQYENIYRECLTHEHCACH